MTKTIVISGVTGFIGEALARFFLAKDYRVKGLTRSPKKTNILEDKGIEPIPWDGQTLTGWEKQLAGVEAVINLSGESIASGRWSQRRKNKILNSRMQAGKIMTEALGHIDIKPKVYVQASAIGIYGQQGDEELDEVSPLGESFLAAVAKQWEAASNGVEELGLRRVICRFGMVLGKNKGALPRMVLPFRFFLGGPLGSGRQWMSWIHIDDLVRAIDFLISNESSRGVYNFTAPQPVINREFARILGKVLHRPSFLPAPAFALTLMLGEMADELLLSGQRVLPKRLKEAEFTFQFPGLEETLQDLLK